MTYIGRVEILNEFDNLSSDLLIPNISFPGKFQTDTAQNFRRVNHLFKYFQLTSSLSLAEINSDMILLIDDGQEYI